MSYHTPLSLQIHRLPSSTGLPYPIYAVEGSAGMDLQAAIDKPIVLSPGQRLLIPTGLQMAIPPTHEGQVRPRSGLALREGITVLNSPGTIDASYRGEIQVLLIHLGQAPFTLTRGMRIAQLVIAPVATVTLVEVSELPPSTRGQGGFGSTGL